MKGRIWCARWEGTVIGEGAVIGWPRHWWSLGGLAAAFTVRVFQHPARHGRFAFLFAPLELVGQLLETQKGSVQGVRRQCEIQRFVRAQPLRLVKRHGHTQFVRSRTHPQFAHHQVRNGLFPIGETSDRGTIGQLNLGQNLTGF